MAGFDLTLWGVGTPRTMRAHWMLAELGLDYTLHPIGSRTGETMTDEFLALNPKHKIPVLRHGRLVLSESAAIVAYLSETFAPPAGFFVPTDAARRARLAEWCFFIMTELDALSMYVIRKHLDLAAIYGEAPNAVAAAKDNFTSLTGAVFKGFGNDRGYLMDEGMSVADILLASCIDSVLKRDVVVPEYLIVYLERIAQRPAYRQALARNHPGLTPPGRAPARS